MTARPNRSKKRDPFVHPGASATDITIGNALAPFDRAIRESEARWGADKLQSLVSPESAAKWGSAIGKLNTAIEAQDVAGIVQRVGVCIRGLAALDAEAIQRGHQPVPAEVWTGEHDGHRFGIIRDAGDWTTLKANHPDLTLYSLHEVGLALRLLRNQVVDEVKKHFPGSQVIDVQPMTELEKSLNDRIPF